MKDKLIIAGGLIFILCVVITCNRCWIEPIQPPKTDTVYVKEQTAVYRPNITVYEPGRIPTEVKTETKYLVRVDSFIQYDKEYITMNIDTAAILADYYAKVFYSDTVKSKYGHIVIQDSVTQNRIASRQVSTDFKLPEKVEKKGQMYFGLTGGYNIADHKVMFGPSLLYKTKNDAIYEAGLLGNSTGNAVFISRKFIINF
jgi:hypothetical protein